MSPPKVITLGALALFGCIGMLALMKGKKEKEETPIAIIEEIVLPKEQKKEEKKQETEEKLAQKPRTFVDKVPRLFALDSSKLPIVETVTYSNRVPWLKDRPAWVADYASYYATSRHFIARSLNKKADYFGQKVSLGDRFNVFCKDKELSFYLVIDLSNALMDFYYYDQKEGKRVLLKTYPVGLGRVEKTRSSGFLTPTGTYKLGERIAIYKPGTLGYFQDQKIEMMRVFGSRWIPFAEEVENCSESYRGYGIHGAPWKENEKGELIEDVEVIGKYESDGCIRLKQEDMEELFSIIITKPSYVVIVSDRKEATLPGTEVEE